MPEEADSVRPGPTWPESQWKWRLCIWIFAWPIIVVGTLTWLSGGLLIFGSFYEYHRAQQSSNWPTAIGVIESSGPMWQHSDEDNHDPKDRGQTFAEIRYKYAVDGKSYDNDGICLDDRKWDVAGHDEKGVLHAIIDKYSPSQKVTVYYQPENPQLAVLIPGGQYSSGSTWALGLFLGAGITVIGSIIHAAGNVLRRFLVSRLG